MQISQELQDSMIRRSVWTPECPVHMESLTYIEIPYINFDGTECLGGMVAHKAMHENITALFDKLHVMKFPIYKIATIDNYNGDDEASMADNNSSCFNFRKIMGTDRFSSHSYGMAIDINPLQNPYIVNPGSNSEKIFPSGGEEFLDRSNIKPGMVEPIVTLMSQHGFNVWGGKWDSPKDYHHFQVSEEIMKKILTAESAQVSS